MGQYMKSFLILEDGTRYEGIRIGAGIRSYQDAIKNARAEYREKIAQASGAEKDRLQSELDDFITAQHEEIKKAQAQNY